MDKGYRISLCIKREEDRYLGMKSKHAKGHLETTQLCWLHVGDISIADGMTKEGARSVIERILAAKMPTEPHDLDVWSLLKLQACTELVRHIPEDFAWALICHFNPVYIGLNRTEDDHNESQWILDLNESQVLGC